MRLRMREIRKDAGLTQSQLAERLLVSKRVISAWERDETPIRLSDAERVAAALDCSLAELVEGRMSPQQAEYNRCWKRCGRAGREVLLVFARFLAELCEKGGGFLDRLSADAIPFPANGDDGTNSGAVTLFAVEQTSPLSKTDMRLAGGTLTFPHIAPPSARTCRHLPSCRKRDPRRRRSKAQKGRSSPGIPLHAPRHCIYCAYRVYTLCSVTTERGGQGGRPRRRRPRPDAGVPEKKGPRTWKSSSRTRATGPSTSR